MLAWHNLAYDKMRFFVAVTGIAFAVALIVVELGPVVGSTRTAASLIDRSGADLWISAPDATVIEPGLPLRGRELATVLATPGVASASHHARARVIGVTRGMRAASPYVLATFETAPQGAAPGEDQTIHLMVYAEPGVGVEVLRQRLADRLTGVEILTTAEFSRKTRTDWMSTTDAGLAVLLAVVLGLVVGVVVVSQTIYATTMDHLREYATLKAMGASNGYLYKVILLQAVISALFGYALGMAIAGVVARGGSGSAAAIVLTPSLSGGMLVLTLAMCVSAAMVSIRKVARLDQALVFKG